MIEEEQPAPVVVSGSLYVVATPIGNLGDLSDRARRVLASVDYIAAEDTRVSRPLLTRLGARAQIFAAHQHNEAGSAARIVALLAQGHSVALISDAGTPAVSDPGTRIVSAALEAGFRVEPVPGPSAVTALLSASGIVEGAFRFEGFLPARARQRDQRLDALAHSDCPVVLFESPHRIEATLAAIAERCGDDRWIALGRELSKKFEEIHRCTAAEARVWLEANPMRSRGEYALVIACAGWHPASSAREPAAAEPDATPATAAADAPLSVEIDRLLAALLPELGTSRSSRVVESLSGRPHREIYARALALAKDLKHL